MVLGKSMEVYHVTSGKKMHAEIVLLSFRPPLNSLIEARALKKLS